MPNDTLHDLIHRVEVDAPDAEPLSRLRTASAMVRELADLGDAALGYFVDQARHAGHSWADIGEALGVTKQAAQQRHTHRPWAALRFGRATPRLRNVLRAADSTAREWGHDFVGTEHLLVALFEEPDGIAVRALRAMGVEEAKLRASVAARTERGPGAPAGRLHFTRKAKQALADAVTAASERGHDFLGTEHLLLGLSQGDGVAGSVLRDAGVERTALDAAIDTELANLGDRAHRAREGRRGRGRGPRAAGPSRGDRGRRGRDAGRDGERDGGREG